MAVPNIGDIINYRIENPFVIKIVAADRQVATATTGDVRGTFTAANVVTPQEGRVILRVSYLAEGMRGDNQTAADSIGLPQYFKGEFLQ